MERLLALLTTTAGEVKTLEAEAKRRLYDRNDQQGYTQHLRHKAILLSGLIDAVAELAPLPAEVDALVRERIGGFSFEADRALRVDSVFYMSVLLCLEDEQAGEGNELDVFIRLLRNQYPTKGAEAASPGNHPPDGREHPPCRP